MVQRNQFYPPWFNLKDNPRREIAKVIVQCKGNLLHTAFRLGIHRSHLYRLVYRHRLWPLINEVRKQYVVQKHTRKIVRGIKV